MCVSVFFSFGFLMGFKDLIIINYLGLGMYVGFFIFLFFRLRVENRPIRTW